MPAPSIKRINVEDFPEQKSWIDKLLNPLNQTLALLNKLLNGGLVITEHVRAELKTLSFVNDSAAFPVAFKHSLSSRPVAVLVVSAAEVTASSTAFTAAVYATWELQPDGKVKILGITGLTASAQYNVTLLVF